MQLGNDARTVQVAQARGMVAVQASCSLREAFGMIASTAEASDTTVEEVASLVVDGEVRFDRELND